MNSQNNHKYIRKLIKIVQDKENQIQCLKKQLRNEKGKWCLSSNNNILNQQITNELGMTSYQLKQVAEQILSMERKMLQMQQGWKQETIKNDKYQMEINQLKKQNNQLKNIIQNLQKNNKQLLKITEIEKNKFIVQIQDIKRKWSSTQLITIKNEQQIQNFKDQITGKDKQLAKLQKQFKEKQQFYKNEIQIYVSSLKLLELQMEQKTKQIEDKVKQMQDKDKEIQDKVNHNLHLKQKLKNYQQFSYQICQYIEAIFVKYCCHGNLRSSKKLIKDDRHESKFQAAFKKITQIQNFFDDLVEKYEKIKQYQELPNETLENLSVIVESIQQKLQLCDLTQMLQREQQQNEEQLLKNLQKQCENSYQKNRSKLVELGQIKQVLKMTKQVNRQLMDQINQKQYIINECKKYYENLIKNKTETDHKKIKNLLNLKI